MYKFYSLHCLVVHCTSSFFSHAPAHNSSELFQVYITHVFLREAETEKLDQDM